MWRAETQLDDFPGGWSTSQLVLQDDIFEASHTYRVRGHDTYLTLIEAQAGKRRYYKAYVASQLDGAWTRLAATKEKPFASPRNVEHVAHWTDSFSHGELIRVSFDQKLEIDLANLQFLFQGVRDEERNDTNYGAIPWQLGLLRLAR